MGTGDRMEQGAVRNLEQIQEHDERPRTPRAVTVALVVLGGACVVFAGLAVSGRRSAPPMAKADPLGELVASRARTTAGTVPARATDLTPRDVTFPGILSDDTTPTTALAAVRPMAGTANANARLVPLVPVPPAPPPAADRLPVVPLPAQNVLEATPIVTRPRDALTKAATDSAQIAVAPPPSAGPGHDGGYQLQVSSFRSQAEADSFSGQLRARSHKAYVLEAHVPGRGTWYRVRIGPFPTQHAAATYRSGFESREHVVPFIVPPSAK